MKIKAVIFGASGMIGQGVLMECLESPLVESVLVINRRTSGMKHPKLIEVIHTDFLDLSPLKSILAEYNSCFFSLGVSAVGLSESEYHSIIYDITTTVAETLVSINKDYTFIYVSGKSTDSTEKGSMMWARVKGKTENALLAMPFRQVFMFRPGYIQPMKGIRSKTALYNAVYFIFKPLYFLLKPLKNAVTDTGTLGKAMINVAANGYSKRILESADINAAGGN